MPPNLPSLTDDLSFLSSEPFEIIAQSGKRYFVHSSRLAKQQKPPRSKTTGVLKGATDMKVDLSGWDEPTVERFVHFLYCGDYRFPGSVAGEKDGGVARDTNLLLVHAKLYALAQSKDVEELRGIALRRLRTAVGETSTRLSSGTREITNVIELLAYVYSNTDLSNPKEPMRTLVLKFAVENVEKLMTRKGEMAPLLEEGGDLTVDLMGKVVRRLRDVEKDFSDKEVEVCNLEKRVHDWRNKTAVLDGKMRQSEITNAETVKKLEDKVRFLEEKLRISEEKIKWFETSSPELAQQWRRERTKITRLIRSIVLGDKAS